MSLWEVLVTNEWRIPDNGVELRIRAVRSEPLEEFAVMNDCLSVGATGEGVGLFGQEFDGGHSPAAGQTVFSRNGNRPVTGARLEYSIGWIANRP